MGRVMSGDEIADECRDFQSENERLRGENEILQRENTNLREAVVMIQAAYPERPNDERSESEELDRLRTENPALRSRAEIARQGRDVAEQRFVKLRAGIDTGFRMIFTNPETGPSEHAWRWYVAAGWPHGRSAVDCLAWIEEQLGFSLTGDER
jgi:hypothetical protein